ncbi:glutathione S-transferase 1 [Ciona intestinalis]
MPTYKLCYFDLRGLGEMGRLIFAEAGAEYTDERIKKEDWPARKPGMPFGKMPVLFVDDVPIAHSRAMVRYLGRTFNLMGSNELEAAQIDMWIEVLFEAVLEYPFSEQDETKKAEKKETAWTDHFFSKFTKLNEQIAKSCGPYILGEKVSVADIVVYAMIELLRTWYDASKFESLGLINKLTETVAARPNIAAWLKKRPQD